MSKLHVLGQMALADFRERTRRYSFLVMLGAVVYLAYLVGSGVYTPTFSGYQGVYNAAWIGASMAVTGTLILCFLGFYCVNSSIQRDRRTGVGVIIAATQVTKGLYIFGKFISNLAVLSVVIAVLVPAAVLIFLAAGIKGGFSLWALLSPFVFLSLPAVAFIAAVAVLFESLKWLRGTVGNIVYIFMIVALTAIGVNANSFYPNLQGFRLLEPSMRAACADAPPNASLYMGPSLPDAAPFLWEGVDWTLELILTRLFWLGVAVLLTTLAVWAFDRFESSDGRRLRTSQKPGPAALDTETAAARSVRPTSPFRLANVTCKFSFVGMLIAELRLMLKSIHWFWYLVAVSLMVAQVAAPFEIARMYITPASMIWPLVIWSSMGTRESRYNTAQLLFSSPRPVRRQLPAIWMNGLLIALAAMGCMLVRVIFVGNWSYLVALLVGALFAPSLALALGTLSGSKKLFEVTYLIVWYLGSIDRIEPLDFLGTTDGAIYGEKLAVYVLFSVATFTIAVLARRRPERYGT
jgi:hypothetical protein